MSDATIERENAGSEIALIFLRVSTSNYRNMNYKAPTFGAPNEFGREE